VIYRDIGLDPPPAMSQNGGVRAQMNALDIGIAAEYEEFGGERVRKLTAETVAA
jgi:hypothetical protein